MNMRYAMRSEDTEQINVVSWANWNMNRYPELKWLHHVPNGGSRNKQEAVKFKQMGVKAGVSDLCLPYPKGIYCGLFIEMKYGNNRQQDTQKEFLADMAAAGHFVATCYSAEEAVKVIEEYCKLMNHKMGDIEIVIPLENREALRNITMSIPNNSILKDGKSREAGHDACGFAQHIRECGHAANHQGRRGDIRRVSCIICTGGRSHELQTL